MNDGRIALPLAPSFLALLVIAYAFTGLVGHAPWKTEDAIGVGIVHQMLAHGHWMLPYLASEPFLEDGPLYYWVAALFAWVFSSLLSAHDGARIASGVLVVFTLFTVRLTARKLYGRTEGDNALLVLLGCLGLLVHAHETLAETAMLAALALAWYALALGPRRAVKSGVVLGAALAAAYLSKGSVAVVPPILVAIALPLASPAWRHRAYLKTLALAALVYGLAAGSWLAVLHARAPHLFWQWTTAQTAAWSADAMQTLGYYVETLSWSAWPAWPIALWFLWDRRRALFAPATRAVQSPGVLLPLAAAVTTLVVILLQKDPRELQAIPMLLPLSLLAGAGTETLRRGAANALAWFGALTFSLFAVLVWLGWFAMVTGTPAQIARNFAKLEPGFRPVLQWLPFLVAVAFTAAWAVLLARSQRGMQRSVSSWASGITVLWGLLMTLWLPWIDYGKTYAPVAQALGRAIPRGAACIESRNLGESQRAVFDYHAGVTTKRAEAHGRNRCPVLLVQARPGDEDRLWAEGWRRVWEGNRPRDRERYRLYVRR